MLICIKTSDMKRTLKFPIQFYFAVNFMLRKSTLKWMMKHSEKQINGERVTRAMQVSTEWIEALDFAELRMAVHELKQYKGMALVDIVTEDGEDIKIII